MAAGGFKSLPPMSDKEVDDVCAAFKKFNMVGLATGKNPDKMTIKAWGKMVQDCIGKDSTTKQRMESSVWAYVTKNPEKQLDLSNKDTVREACGRMAEVYKEVKKSKDGLEGIRTKLVGNITTTGPDVKKVETSKTGNVGGLTDTSKYTGAHKERFDKDGQGKGAEGREDRHDNTGYTGQYKGSGTYKK